MTEPPPWDAELQALTNAHPVPPREQQHWTQTPAPVIARCVWERDGEQRQAGMAVAWTSHLVLVHFEREMRLQVHGAWFAIHDVKRR